jgi:hypothetical protein
MRFSELVFLTSHLHCIASKSVSFPFHTLFHRQLHMSMATTWMAAPYGSIHLNLLWFCGIALVSIDGGVQSVGLV